MFRILKPLFTVGIKIRTSMCTMKHMSSQREENGRMVWRERRGGLQIIRDQIYIYFSLKLNEKKNGNYVPIP